MRIFVSHVREEKVAAATLKSHLETALPGATVWVSSVDLSLGAAWLQALEAELKGAKVLLVLCSSQSVGKPWINFECGFGHGKRVAVIPVCHRGLRKQHLPYPLSMFQACELTEPDDCSTLVSRLAQISGLSIADGFTAQSMSQTFLPRLTRGHEIGVVLAHRQGEWAMPGHHSPFDLPTSLPDSWRDRWMFRSITTEDKIAAAEMASLSGLIVGNPWRSAMSRESIDELVDWVCAGGRMLLLGYELGDRHHGGNLGDLSRRFGIHPMIDIVGPREHGPGKPYGVWLDFEAQRDRPHRLTDGLTRIRLRNVQTVMVEPGGLEWLRVGKHATYRPTGTVYYRDGTLTQAGGTQFEVNADTGWVPVGVDAPAGLTGSGKVRFLGTWDFLQAPSTAPARDGFTLAERLFDWLASSEGSAKD